MSAVDIPGNQVATVGYFNVFPNAANIVPGQVDLTIDLRDLSLETLETMVNIPHRNNVVREQMSYYIRCCSLMNRV